MRFNKNYGLICTILNIILLVSLQFLFDLGGLARSFLFVGAGLSIIVKIIEKYYEKHKERAIFLNHSLTVFLIGSLLAITISKSISGKLQSNLLFTIMHATAIFLIIGLAMLALIASSVTEKENEKLKEELKDKANAKKTQRDSKLDIIINALGFKNVKDLLRDNIKEYNGLIAIGNLLSLRKKDGVRFLEEYLESTKGQLLNNKKVSYLVVPRESLFYLRDIFKNLKDKNLLPQIRIITIYPFVLIQGLLIIGNFTSEEKNIDVKSYFKYKANLREDEDMIDNGIFSNLEDSSVIDEYTISNTKESLIFIFQSLVNNYYDHPDKYKIFQSFFDSNKERYEYKLIMRKSPMCFYCDLQREKCEECPIYNITVTEDAENVKEFFEGSGKKYMGGIYEKSKSDSRHAL